MFVRSEASLRYIQIYKYLYKYVLSYDLKKYTSEEPKHKPVTNKWPNNH